MYLTQNKSLMEKWKNTDDMSYTENKIQSCRCKFYLIGKYIKYKWIKHSS